MVFTYLKFVPLGIHLVIQRVKMRKEIRSSLWLTLMAITLVSCDSMIVGEDGNEIAEQGSLVISEPLIERIDLNQFGLNVASDINDHGDIVGGQFYWQNDVENLINVGFLTRALNNKGQIIGQKEYWDADRGLVEIDVLNYDGIEFSSVYAYDINDKGEVIGEVDSCYRSPSWDDIPADYCEYDFWSMSWNIDDRVTRELEWFSIAKSINNKGDRTNLSYTYAPHEIYNSFGSFGPYQGFGNGEPNSINNSGDIVGSIRIVPQSDSNLNVMQFDESSSKEMSVENKLMRITNSNGRYNYNHVVEMLRSSTIESDIQLNINGKGGFVKGELFNENLLHHWSEEEQQNIIEAALAGNFNSEAFIWDEENGIESIGTLNNGDWSTAFDINDHGQVVGYSDIGNNEYRAFYWDKENGMIELPSNGKNSIARAINNNGQIVGENDGPVMWEITLPQGN